MGAPIPRLTRPVLLAGSDSSYPCAYCGGERDADSSGNCDGCGARKPGKRRIDITCIGDRERRYLWID